METTISALAAQLQPPRPTPAVPVLPALRELLPDRGLRPGTAVRVGGSTALTLALLAAATTAGTWCAAIGCEGLGLVAAAEIGVALGLPDADGRVRLDDPTERLHGARAGRAQLGSRDDRLRGRGRFDACLRTRMGPDRGSPKTLVTLVQVVGPGRPVTGGRD
ncbi:MULTISPECIES: hypothetical protein [unclassified Kitasatospora]|uniref:hypothetical protein n=1 Tax=unclassified Kitasatospora TaxID=2633591 RepID=UPI0033C0EC69